MPHVAVIGAGPAGSTAALLLSRSGWYVTLIEQHRFPRDKVCGECLSRLGVATLERLGLLYNVLDLGAIWLRRANLFSPDGNSTSIALPTPMLGISRGAFDQFLLEAAISSGARVRQPVRCERVETKPRPLLRLRELSNNTIDDLAPDCVIVADGKPLRGETAPDATGDFGIKAHFTDVDGPRDAIELFGCDRTYGGLAAIEGGRWNAAFSVRATRLRDHAGDIAGLFAEITDENPQLARRMRSARRVGPWLTAPLPRYPVRRIWSRGIIPAGNAAAALEPIGGEGMGLAMRSAELAVAALTADSSGPDLSTLKRQYDTLWRVRSAGCRVAGWAAAVPGSANLALPFIASQPQLTARFIDAIGK